MERLVKKEQNIRHQIQKLDQNIDSNNTTISWFPIENVQRSIADIKDNFDALCQNVKKLENRESISSEFQLFSPHWETLCRHLQLRLEEVHFHVDQIKAFVHHASHPSNNQTYRNNVQPLANFSSSAVSLSSKQNMIHSPSAKCNRDNNSFRFRKITNSLRNLKDEQTNLVIDVQNIFNETHAVLSAGTRAIHRLQSSIGETQSLSRNSTNDWHQSPNRLRKSHKTIQTEVENPYESWDIHWNGNQYSKFDFNNNNNNRNKNDNSSNIMMNRVETRKTPESYLDETDCQLALQNALVRVEEAENEKWEMEQRLWSVEAENRSLRQTKDSLEHLFDESNALIVRQRETLEKFTALRENNRHFYGEDEEIRGLSPIPMNNKSNDRGKNEETSWFSIDI